MELPASCARVQYCSPVSMSSAASHFRFFDRVESKAVRLSDGLVVCDLEHRRCVVALCMFYKIRCNANLALKAALPPVRVLARLTRLAVSIHYRYLDFPRCRTVQFGWSFASACT